MKESANCTSVTTKHTEILGIAYTINQSELGREYERPIKLERVSRINP